MLPASGGTCAAAVTAQIGQIGGQCTEGLTPTTVPPPPPASGSDSMTKHTLSGSTSKAKKLMNASNSYLGTFGS